MCNCKMGIPILETPPTATPNTVSNPVDPVAQINSGTLLGSMLPTLQFIAVTLTIIISIRILFFNK